MRRCRPCRSLIAVVRRLAFAPPGIASLGIAALLLGGLLAGCRAEAPSEEPVPEEGERIVVLSERDEEVVGDLLAAWSAATGYDLEVRYGAPGELAAAALAGDPPEEPTILLAGDEVGLAGLAAARRAQPLPADLTAAVRRLFVDPERRWVGLTGRARVVVYDPQRMSTADLPAGLRGFGDPAHEGRFGLAPESRSLRIHLAAYRALHGPEGLARLLERLAANEPRLLPDDEALVRAVRDHEIDFALVDHAAVWRVRAAERGEAAGGPGVDGPGAQGLAVLPLPAADASGYLGLTGVALLAPYAGVAPAAGEAPTAGEASSAGVAPAADVAPSAGALALVRHLLGEAAQAHLAATTFEYPLVPAVEPPAGLVPLADLDLAQVDYRAVAAALDETEAAIEESGLAP
jgi:iron(III) transport system substrate-binding protein